MKKNDELIAPFTWTRCPDGYEWKTGVTPATPKKTTTGLVPCSDERLPYEPPADLFLTLAATPATKEGIQEFATNFGMLDLNTDTDRTIDVLAHERMRLGLGRPDLRSAVKTTVWSNGRLGFIDEPLAKWRRAIGELSYMVGRWDVSRGKVKLEDDLPGFAKIDLRDTLNKHLRTAVALEVSLYDMRNAGAHLLDPGAKLQLPSHHSLQLVAQSLLGHCWLQLALAVDGRARFGHCLACQRMLKIRPSGIRRPRKTCSDNCRIRVSYYRSLYRSRRISIADIAKRLNSDPLTVRAWARG